LNHYHTFEADKIYQDNIDHFQKIDSGWLEGEVKLDEKGLSEITYQHILDAIQELEQPFTIQELAKCSQFSHVSVRKYIAYMEEKGLLTSQQIYTKVGRPYKVYKLIKKNLGL
ncbi:two-component system response regulator, partial [Streptococcus agalactiae]|nr:two-component system response regulator [Streptococcus agalactiae]MCK6378660.1 two-component system response regulator [Streptococcus agalactiae]